MAALKRILRYVAGTLKSQLPLREDSGGTAWYADSDLAGDVNTWKSTSGVLFFTAAAW
jgi:hypothetical protein